MSRLTAFVAAALMGAATLTVVAQTTGPAGAETFAGPNGRIAYVAGGIWTMDPDKTDPQYLGGGTWPSWSPDGHQIAFAYVAPGDFIESLWVMNADGTNRHKVYGGGITAIATNPSWSPDGTEIAFAHREYFLSSLGYVPRDAEIAVIKPDGSGLQELTNNGAQDEWPEWSPDGSTIVYQTSINPGPGPSDINYDVYAVASDGLSAPVQLTSESGWEQRPSWSPDGTTIVYDRAAVANTSSKIWLMDADGSDQRVLSQTGSSSMWMATYSPDGSTILFSMHSGNAGSDWNIAAVPAVGGTTTLLTTATATEWGPAWQADSTPPTITCDPAPTFIVGEAGAEVTATVADDPGGIGVSSTSLSAPAGTGSVGSFTVAFNASDQAGNDAEETSCGYEVEPPAITGQLAPPVDPLPALNQAKAGRVIPIKFRVVDELGAPVLGLVDPVVRTTNRACDSTVLPDAVEEYVANSGFREHEAGWYQWNWATPSGYAGSCRTLTVELQGAVVVTADFKFVR